MKIRSIALGLGLVALVLGQFWVVFGQAREGRNRIASFTGVALHDAFDETHLGVARFGGQVLIGFG